MAKKGQVFKKYSPELKLSVILDMRSNHLGYKETARKNNLVISLKLKVMSPVKYRTHYHSI